MRIAGLEPGTIKKSLFEQMRMAQIGADQTGGRVPSPRSGPFARADAALTAALEET